MNWNRKLLLLWLLMGIFAPTVLGQSPAIQAPTLYEQCPTLTNKPSAGEGIKRASATPPTKNLQSKNPKARLKAAAQPSAEDGVKRTLAALKDKEPKTRIEAAQQLSKMCDQRAVGPLIAALKDEDPLVRVAVVEALGHLGDRAAIEPLIEAVQDQDWRVMMALGRALCSFQAHSASDAALNSLANNISRPITDENDLRARCTTILAITQLRDVNFSRKAVYIVFVLLDHERESYRRIAEQTMFELKKTRNGKRELIGILKQNNNPIFRQKAADWLGKLAAEEARGALGEASVADGDARVRGAAAESLRLLDESKKESGSGKDRSPLFQ